MKKSFPKILFTVLISSFLISGVAYAASITAPDVPRFGTPGADNEITGAERAGFQIIFNFTTSGDITTGDRIYLLNGTSGLQANFTTPIFVEITTQEQIDQLSLNFTNTQLSGLSDGSYSFSGQWVDRDGGTEAGPIGTIASSLVLDSDTTPTATITPTPATPSGSKSSLSFAIEFSEPMDPATFTAVADLDIDFDGAGFANAAGTLSAVDTDSYTYTLSAGELTTIGTGTPSETVTLRLLASVDDTGGNAVSTVDSVWTYDASIGASTGGGSGCDDCEAPTLGINKNGQRLVSNGFTYNGHSVDAERFFTPYPLITANVGKTNTADFRLYENEGISNIRHFTLAFGMDEGDIISDSKAKIELDIDFQGTETVIVTDPENALDHIKVTTSTVSCMDDSYSECLGISIQHRFRAPLDFNIVATDTWDSKRNSWQNYFNHGIEVVGESLNPAKEYDGINKGHIYHLTETSKTTAVDEFGNSWTLQYGLWNKDIQLHKTPVTLFLNEIILLDNAFAGSDQFGIMYYLTETSKTTAVDMFGNSWIFDGALWTMDYIYSKIILESTPMGGYTRTDSEFDTYKYGQFLLAENKLHKICPECSDKSYGEIDNVFFYDFPVKLEKLGNFEILSNMAFESERAQIVMANILD